MIEDVEQIKILCVVTHILEMTRRLDPEDKTRLERFCDKIMLKREDSKHSFKTLQDYKKNNIDLLAISKVSALPLKHEFLKNLY